MPRMRAEDRKIAIGHLEAEESESSLVHHFNVQHSVVLRLWRRYQQLGSTQGRPRTGRPKITRFLFICTLLTPMHAFPAVTMVILTLFGVYTPRQRYCQWITDYIYSLAYLCFATHMSLPEDGHMAEDRLENWYNSRQKSSNNVMIVWKLSSIFVTTGE